MVESIRIIDEKIRQACEKEMFEVRVEEYESEVASRLKEHFKREGFYVEKIGINVYTYTESQKYKLRIIWTEDLTSKSLLVD